jgi:hypothetical protein
MEQTATDKSVWTEVQALHSTKRLIWRETTRAITPFGGVAVFVAYLRKIDLTVNVREHMPVQWRSPNNIDPTATFIAFLIAVLAGAKRFAHVNCLHGDRALQALLSMSRFPCDDTIGNLFRQFSLGHVQRLFEPLIEWQMQRVPVRAEGHSLDLDATIFERYGRQEGSLKGHNPRQHGRPSHHSLLAVLSEAHFILPGWATQRRFVVIGERVRENRASVGRQLIEVPGDPFRILFNLLAEFQRAAAMPGYRELTTIRTQVLTCGAILGRSARRLVVHLGESWGGLKTRKPLLASILEWEIPTSPKLIPAMRC